MITTKATVATGTGAFGSRWALDRNGDGSWSVTREHLTTSIRTFNSGCASEQEAREYFATYTTPIVGQTA